MTSECLTNFAQTQLKKLYDVWESKTEGGRNLGGGGAEKKDTERRANDR